MEISKFFKKGIKLTEKKDTRKLYIQALLPKTSKNLKIKKKFPKLQTNKIENIYKIINSDSKSKTKLNITTKDPSRKQVIILINNDNKAKFMKSFSSYITNLNRALKNIKSEVIVDFICMDQADITIVTNKVISSLDLQTIKKYIKNANYINSDKVNTSHLPQSKFYLKFIGIPYFFENTNTSISLDIAETIIKNNHILNNIAITSKL